MLSLVLVMAFAATAMAEVNMGGWYQLEVDQVQPTGDAFEMKEFTTNTNFALTLSGTNNQDSHWQFDGNLFNARASDPILNNYRIQLWEGDFKLDLSQGRRIGWVNTNLNLIRAHQDVPSARATFPVADVVDVIADFEYEKQLIVFADLVDHPVGFAIEQDFSGATGVTSAVVHGEYDFSDVTVTGAVGYTLDTTGTDGLAAAVSVATNLTDELSVNAEYRQIGSDYGVTYKTGGNDSKLFETNFEYSIPNVLVNAGFETTGNIAAFNEDKISASVTYFTANLPNWDHMTNNLDNPNDARHAQFAGNRWLKRIQGVNGLAVEFGIDQTRPKAAGSIAVSSNEIMPEVAAPAPSNVLEVRGRVVSPIVDDMLWGLVHTDYNMDTKNAVVRAGLSAKATDNLSIYPKVNYSINDSADNEMDVNLQVQYDFGDHWVGLNLGQAYTASDLDSQFARFTVRVGF